LRKKYFFRESGQRVIYGHRQITLLWPQEFAFGPAPITALIRFSSFAARSDGVFHSNVLAAANFQHGTMRDDLAKGNLSLHGRLDVSSTFLDTIVGLPRSMVTASIRTNA
jgi:hypothetical protein